MDVLNRQVGEYENEIRALKDFKSPSKGSRSRATPRRAVTSVADTVSSPHGRAQAVSEEAEIYSGALEATLFRPSLQRALKDAAFWKASVVRESLSNLPALPVAKSLKVLDDQESENGDDLVELTLALADYRIAMASTSLVDLTRKDKTPRAQLRESTATKQAASQRLHAVLRRYQGQSFYC
jgi:dynactin 1